MKRKEEPSLKGFVKTRPRTITPTKENEGIARFYFKKGRLVLNPALLKHLGVLPGMDKSERNRILHFEIFFDLTKKLIAVRFIPKATTESFKASDAKGSRFIELRGPCKSHDLNIPETGDPIDVVVCRNVKEDFLYFSYESFVDGPISKK